LSLFLRESIRKWRIEMNNTDQPNTAYNVSISLMLKSDDYGVKVFEIVEVDEAPVATKTYVPQYPPILKSSRIQGSVSVVFTVDPKGNVRDVEVESSTNRGFNQPAVDSVKRWKFKPGIKNGNPVYTRVRAPMQFNLERN